MDNEKKLDQEEIRQRLNEFKAKHDLKHRKLSAMLEVSESHLSEFLRGQRVISDKLLVHMNNLMKTYKVTYSLRDENF